MGAEGVDVEVFGRWRSLRVGIGELEEWWLHGSVYVEMRVRSKWRMREKSWGILPPFSSFFYSAGFLSIQ